jgi:enamine deaminase RidA (YjgF/YER057c/UK114 family)
MHRPKETIVTNVTEGATQRLVRLGLTLPDPPAAVAAFEPFVHSGDMVYTSGQIATRDGQLVAAGRVGAEVDLATGQEAARVCALNVLAQLRVAAGSLDNIDRLVKITVFVASADDFTLQPQVADGASRLLIDVLGPAGKHARSAIGVAALPLGTPVEIEAVAMLRPASGKVWSEPR